MTVQFHLDRLLVPPEEDHVCFLVPQQFKAHVIIDDKAGNSVRVPLVEWG